MTVPPQTDADNLPCILQEMLLWSSSVTRDRQSRDDFCWPNNGTGPCGRLTKCPSEWRAASPHDFRSLELERRIPGRDHLTDCPFARRWKRSYGEHRDKASPAFHQTAYLRCWLSRHNNRMRLFESGVPFLTVGYAFYDQSAQEIVYSTGGKGLIYLPFYRPTDHPAAQDAFEFDEYDRFKHDVLALLRSQHHDGPPKYAQIFNSSVLGTEAETLERLRSPFERDCGIILAPDGEITCFALNYFLRRMAIQLNDASAISGESKLAEFLAKHFDTQLDIYPFPGKMSERAQRKVHYKREQIIGRLLLDLLAGRDPGVRRIDDPAEENPDYEYVPELLQKKSILTSVIKPGGMRCSLRQYLYFLGLVRDDTRQPTERFHRLVSWLNGYACSELRDFQVPAIKSLFNEEAKTPFAIPEEVDEAQIAAFLAELATRANFSCCALDDHESNSDRWAKATRTTFLGHTVARCNSFSASSWLAFPIQAERGSQSVSRNSSKQELQDIGFLLSLIDAGDGNRHLDPFAGDVPNIDELNRGILNLKQVGYFLGKLEADSVYWLGIIDHQIRNESRSSAIAAIAAQSLSHNIGSHALSDSQLFDLGNNPDAFAVKDFHHYLQGRLDYVAQLLARAPPPAEPMHIWGDVFVEFFRQRLLLNRLVADRGVQGRNLSFALYAPGASVATIVEWKHILAALSADGGGEKAAGGSPHLSLPSGDVLVAIPGGTVGCHALYGLIENVMRNSVKYGCRMGDQKDLCISVRLRDPGPDKDYWLLELWDNFSGFSVADEETLYSALATSFRRDVADASGNMRASGHGLVEIKEAMRYLHSHDDRDTDGFGQHEPWAAGPCHCSEDAVNCRCRHANMANMFDAFYGGEPDTMGTLVYRVRLQRPKLLGIWRPDLRGRKATFQSLVCGIFVDGELSRSRIEVNGGGSSISLATMAPHLLAVCDDPTADIASMANELARHHWRLPYRTFVVTADEERAQQWTKQLERLVHKRPIRYLPTGNQHRPRTLRGGAHAHDYFIPRNRVRVLHAPELHNKLRSLSDANLGIDLVIEVYDRWITAFKPLRNGQKWQLMVCFDRTGMAVRWPCAEAFNNTSKSCSIAVYDDGGQKLCAGTTVNPADLQTILHFGNHGTLPSIGRLQRDKLRFSQYFGTQTAPRSFAALYSPPQDAQSFAFFLLSLAESALTTVAIFDERVIAVALAINSKRPAWSAGGIQECWSAGVIPLMGIPSGLKGLRALARADLPEINGEDSVDWVGSVVAPFLDEMNRAVCNVCKVTVSTAALPREADGVAPDEKTIGPIPVNSRMGVFEPGQFPQIDIDVLVLHEGLSEELISRSLLKRWQDLAILRVVPRVVRTSGKGRGNRKLYVRHPFAEYSSIAVACAAIKGDVHTRLEKHYLARALLDCTGETLENDVCI